MGYPIARYVRFQASPTMRVPQWLDSVVPAIPVHPYKRVVAVTRGASAKACCGAAGASESRPITLPVIDGKDIRFKRLSTADGLSQTRVSSMVRTIRASCGLARSMG